MTIEELFTEGNRTEATESGEVHISEMSFSGVVNEFLEKSVEIPPTSLRVKHFCKLLSMVEEETIGELAGKKEKLMRMALGFKIYSTDSARDLSQLIKLLERLGHEAQEDPRLSGNCRKSKPKVFKEVRCLLMLRALTDLQYLDVSLNSREKSDILHILGFTGGYEQIEDYRIECVKNGCGQDIDIGRLAGYMRSLNAFKEMGSKRATQMLIPLIYFASCFAADHLEIKELFESKEWNYNVKNYIIR